MSSLASKLNLSNLSLPPATKALLIATTAGSLLLQFLKRKAYKELIQAGQTFIDMDKIIVPYLQLVPNHTLFHPWTIVTAIFVDMYIWRYLLSFVVMFFAGKFIERSWSSKELVKFVLLVGAASNLFTSVSIIFLNLIFGTTYFDIPVDGNACILVAYLVVFKQLIPEHSIVLFKGAANARVKHIPFATLVCFTVVSALSATWTPAVQAWIGFVVAWIYLRFFQPNVIDPLLPHPNDTVGVKKIYGDASETFSFVHFFPDVMAPLLTPIFNQIYELAVEFGFLTRFDQSDIEHGNMIAGRRSTGHPSSSADTRNAAERRRQVALKVLEERIGEESKKPASPAPESNTDA